MSTPAVSPDLKALDAELNQSILSGDIMEGFEKFYADDIVMQENNEAPRVGKDINRKAELDFLSAVQEFHGARLLGSAVNGDRSYSEWEIDATYKNGQRHKQTQVAARQWKNGQIVHERFYYTK